jgi:heme exporter protein C
MAAPTPTLSSQVIRVLTVLTALAFFVHIWFIFAHTPQAQATAGGLAQKIFYFHAPAAYAMYLAGGVCFLASAAYLVRPTDHRNAWATAGSEVAVTFGLLVLTSGPLWAKKAWGVYWTWDPRLTSLLLTVLIYGALTLLRRFSGSGEAERKFAAAFGILGTTVLPIVHYSVKLWRGNHPTVVGKGGGGLSPVMLQALLFGFVTMTLLCCLLLWLRKNLVLGTARLEQAEELASTLELPPG